MSKDQIEIGTIVKCDTFGTVNRIRHDESAKRMVADIQLSPLDVRSLLELMHELYKGKVAKRRKRIAELANELAILVDKESSFHFEGTAFVSGGDAIRLCNDTEYLEATFDEGK